MVSKKKYKNKKIFFLSFFELGKTEMVLGNRWLFSIQNGAEIPLYGDMFITLQVSLT